LRCRRLTAFGGCKGFGQRAFPARLDDDFAHRAQRLAGAVEIRLGAVVFMVGQKLRQVARANQCVDRPMLAGELPGILAGAGGNDAVVGADLGVVPRPRAALGIEMRHQFVDGRVGPAQGGKDLRRVAMLTQWQVAAIAARVGDGLVGFVQRLGDVQGFLGAETELLRADFLQRPQVEGQGRDLAHAFGAQLHQPRTGGVGHGVGGVPGELRVEAAALVVTGVVDGAPLGGEGHVRVAQVDVDGPVGHRYEIGDAAVAVDHQAQGRGLHPAHRQHALVTGLAAEQGKQAAHVHADQPVGAGTAEGRVVQAEGLGAGFERGQGLADGGVVQRRQPQALDRPAIAAMFHQLAGDHFALAVGVGGDHQFQGFPQQALDRLELGGGLGLDPHLPFVRDDRQVGEHPALVLGVVGVGRGGFQQVADAPGDSHPVAQPATVATARGAEHGRNILGLGGFFTEEQPHGHHIRSG